MHQVILPIDGQPTQVIETPDPSPGSGEVLIANHFSLISAGTERATVELARQPLWRKARSRPDQVARMVDKVRQEGVAATMRQVRSRLSRPMPLGYASAGVVVGLGADVRDLSLGDRVASNGPHAGMVAVPRNLVATVPDDVPLDQACYAVLGAVALQGVRLARVGLGDVVLVIGLGLVGQLAIALLKSAGCHVVGTDLDPRKCELARVMGADEVGAVGDIRESLDRKTGGQGVDAILIAASTPSDAPLKLAACLARKKGRVVAVGSVGMNVPRREFYDKELELVVSCSYGPGRYDADYETKGRDYPYAYVRWTEQRNIEAVLDQMAAGRLPVHRLTSHRYPIEQAASAYQLIENPRQPSLGVLLEYPRSAPATRLIPIAAPTRKAVGAVASATKPLRVSVIGAGQFAGGTLLPILSKRRDVALQTLVSAKGLSARTLAEQFGFAHAGTDVDLVFNDSQTDAVVIATRHDDHAPLALAALRANKHVFLEKPLAIHEDQCDLWRDAIAEGIEPVLMMGYNRRFSAPAVRLKEELERLDAPLVLSIRFNAGKIEPNHWIHDPRVGGGRIVGEGCHAIDLAIFLQGSIPTQVAATAVTAHGRRSLDDEVVLTLTHANGGVSSILYASGGDRSMGKERIEVFGGGLTAIIDDFRSLEIRRDGRRLLRRRWWSQSKGYAEEMQAWLSGVRQGAWPIPASELLASAESALAAVRSLRLDLPMRLDSSPTSDRIAC